MPPEPASPTAAPSPPHPRLDLLATAYMVLGVTDLLWALFVTAVGLLRMIGEIDTPLPDAPPGYEAGRQMGYVASLALQVTGLPVGAFTLFAGLKMRRAESYALAMTAVVLNMLPCYQTVCCALLGLPIGVWALVTLFDPEVKATFR